MTVLKTRSLERIEERMAGVSEDSIRHTILKSARNFKTSWMELGQALYTAWKDKLYKDWGYITFDAYTSKEIGIKKNTAIKLLKSYYFLEKEEPNYIKSNEEGSDAPASMPTYEAVNLLRLAKNKKNLDSGDYAQLKRDILHKGKDVGAARRDITTLIKQREELEPEEAIKKRRIAAVKRLLAMLKTLKTDLSTSKMVSADILKDTENLIRKVEREVL